MAFSAATELSTRPGKSMMIGCPTPTVEPLTGATLGGPNGAAPTKGVGSCPAGGWPRATGGTAITTRPTIAAVATALTVLHVQCGMGILSSSGQCSTATWDLTVSGGPKTPTDFTVSGGPKTPT